LGVVGISILAVALGGTTELWAQGIIALLASILILLFPPQLMPDRTPTILLLLFFGLALAAFIPADLWPMPEWQRHLRVDLQLPLGPFRTAQPWLTLQACGLLYLGVLWTWYLLSQDWNNAEKSLALRLVVSGVIFLAAAAIVTYTTGFHVPIWKHEANRGWFPNRNQSASVLMLSGIACYAIAFRAFQKKQASFVFWTIGLIAIGTALVICYSRAGILLFFAGIGIWHATGLFRQQKGQHFAFGATAVLLLLSLFLLFGGTTLERFLKVDDGSNPLVDHYRLLLQEDAFTVTQQSPILGVGLGNFEPVFTSMRHASADQNRAIHPESDWLWMAVEMGWLAPLLVLAGLWWWFLECLPFEAKQGEILRRAAMVAAVMFVLHSFVDVGGHRIGSFFIGVLMASVALAPKPRGFNFRGTALVFRAAALVLGLIGAWWTASAWADWGPPTTATLDRLQAKIDLESSNGRLASMSEAANAGLEVQPLNWTYYFRRASAEAFRNGGTDAAANDFLVARFLEPHSIDLCVAEGEVWLGADEPDRCLESWREALHRSDSKRGIAIYTALLEMARNSPEVHSGLEQSTTINVDYLITFLNYATPEEAKTLLDDLLSRDPNLESLNSDQLRKLFSAWNDHGNKDDLAALLLSHTQLQIAGWKFLSQHFADQKDYSLACMTALHYLPPPAVPQDSTATPSAEPNHFDDHPEDVLEGIQLCKAQMQANQVDDALDTIAKLEKLKDSPRYIFYLKAQLYVKKQMWEEAWNALQQIDAAP
jgi:tetratricopeptide (TPR) repeat protein